MNFFEHQERARGTTRALVLLFIGAVVSLILVATLLVTLILSTSDTEGAAPAFDPATLPLDVLAGVSAVVLTVVALGAAFRFLQLRAGGKAVAQGLGGRLLNVNTRNMEERKVLNVVEEMAIAAGVPVPQVYLLEEAGINAFAAGHTPQDAVIGVTRGCIALLDRDELQGVIAHEFSHIFNGDMRLNLRLIGWLYGITVLGLIGYFLLRGQGVAAARSRNNNSRGALVLMGL
ncbi:MAG TPA: M48 family metalloprotease, partial [Hyphomicrobiales bacterium]|nr:M48 family metalloprotease [Hyphomicrobiales bacterium]